MRSRELRINIFVCVQLVKLVKEKIVILLSYTRANKTRQGKLVRRTHEQVNSSRKLTCQGKLARPYEHRGKTSAHAMKIWRGI